MSVHIDPDTGVVTLTDRCACPTRTSGRVTYTTAVPGCPDHWPNPPTPPLPITEPALFDPPRDPRCFTPVPF